MCNKTMYDWHPACKIEIAVPLKIKNRTINNYFGYFSAFIIGTYFVKALSRLTGEERRKRK